MMRYDKTLYLAYLQYGHRLKIGVSKNLKRRFIQLQNQYGPVCLIGYRIFDSAQEAFENERRFVNGWRKDRSEVFAYSEKEIDKFKSIQGSICNKFMDLKELKFPTEGDLSMNQSFRTKMEKWRETLGYEIAKKRLIANGISLSLAQKLLAGTYPNQPRAMYLTAIEKAMKSK